MGLHCPAGVYPIALKRQRAKTANLHSRRTAFPPIFSLARFHSFQHSWRKRRFYETFSASYTSCLDGLRMECWQMSGGRASIMSCSPFDRNIRFARVTFLTRHMWTLYSFSLSLSLSLSLSSGTWPGRWLAGARVGPGTGVGSGGRECDTLVVGIVRANVQHGITTTLLWVYGSIVMGWIGSNHILLQDRKRVTGVWRMWRWIVGKWKRKMMTGH